MSEPKKKETKPRTLKKMPSKKTAAKAEAIPEKKEAMKNLLDMKTNSDKEMYRKTTKVLKKNNSLTNF